VPWHTLIHHLHDTTGCTTVLRTGCIHDTTWFLTTDWMFVYMIQPVVNCLTTGCIVLSGLNDVQTVHTCQTRSVRKPRPPAYIQGPASISTIMSDPGPVLEVRLVFKARLLFKEIRYITRKRNRYFSCTYHILQETSSNHQNSVCHDSLTSCTAALMSLSWRLS